MEDFKKKFSPGDIICIDTYANKGRPFVITAIGEKRFLYRDLGRTGDERVKTVMHSGPSEPFRFWNPKAWPDGQYAYALERESGHKEVSEKIVEKAHIRIEL